MRMKRVRFINPIQSEDTVTMSTSFTTNLKLSCNASPSSSLRGYHEWKYNSGKIILEETINGCSIVNTSKLAFYLLVPGGYILIPSGERLPTFQSFRVAEDYLEKTFHAIHTSLQCSHTWETKQLFTSSYEVCSLCKQEKGSQP